MGQVGEWNNRQRELHKEKHTIHWQATQISRMNKCDGSVKNYHVRKIV